MKESIKVVILNVIDAIVTLIAYGLTFCAFFINFMSVDDNEVFDEKGIDIYNWFYHALIQFIEYIGFSIIALIILYSIKYLMFVKIFKIKTLDEIYKSLIFQIKILLIVAIGFAILFYIIKPWF